MRAPNTRPFISVRLLQIAQNSMSENCSHTSRQSAVNQFENNRWFNCAWGSVGLCWKPLLIDRFEHSSDTKTNQQHWTPVSLTLQISDTLFVRYLVAANSRNSFIMHSVFYCSQWEVLHSRWVSGTCAFLAENVRKYIHQSNVLQYTFKINMFLFGITPAVFIGGKPHLMAFSRLFNSILLPKRIERKG